MAELSPEQRELLILEAWERRVEARKKALRIEAAKDHLIPFAEHNKANYRADWFHTALAGILEQFLADVIAGKKPRLIISAPPQHGKSELVSRQFPVWATGKHPGLRFICGSYSSVWAEQLSSDRLRILDSPEFKEIFPDLKLVKKRADYLENALEGFMFAAGVDCGITGRSADIGIIDDPIKGHKEAVSPTVRESIYNWYLTDFHTRLQKGAGVIVMATRWHEDDLIGRLLDAAKNGGEQWTVYNFPAMWGEKDDPSKRAEIDKREIGEPLAPGRFGVQEIEEKRMVLGSYAFGALYQGHPAPAEGLMLQRDHWRYYEKHQLPEFDIIGVFCDAAFKKTEDSDHVAIHVWGFIGPRGYCLDRICERMGYVATKQTCLQMALKWKADILGIEDAANGPAAIEELTKTLGGKVTIVALPAGGGKLARAWPFSADLEAGNAWLPADEAWAGEIVDYAARFPATAMDHDVDAFTHAFAWRKENMHGLFEYLRKQYEATLSQLPASVSPKGLAKVETADETTRCGQCSSPAIRDTSGWGNFRCNQCGFEWVKTGALENAPELWGRVF